MQIVTWRKTIGFLAALLACAAAAEVAAQSNNVPAETLLAALPPQTQASETLAFDVLMDGSKIGRHVVSLWNQGDRTYVDIDIALKVGLGPIVFYRYEQRNRALWENGALVSFISNTDDDGDAFAVRASRNGDGLSVAVNGTDGIAVSDWFPTTYWNKRTVTQDRLLATRDGEVLAVDTKFVGVETVKAGGRDVTAERFEMRGDLDIDLWYDENDRWVKLAFDYRGNRFDYVLR
jgi:hypothetical protein